MSQNNVLLLLHECLLLPSAIFLRKRKLLAYYPFSKMKNEKERERERKLLLQLLLPPQPPLLRLLLRLLSNEDMSGPAQIAASYSFFRAAANVIIFIFPRDKRKSPTNERRRRTPCIIVSA